MKTFIAVLSVSVLSLLFVSCQKEVDGELPGLTEDSTTVVIPMFRLVEIPAQTPQDSVVKIFKSVIVNGQKSVVVSELIPGLPSDTLNYIFSYNTAGKLSTIKEVYSSSPAVVTAQTSFTWNASTLSRVRFDTMGVFEQSVDFAYSTVGANTVITSTTIPSLDIIQPDYFYKYKNSLTVNSLFLPVEEKWQSHTYIFQGGVAQNVHDSTIITHRYTANDLSQSDFFTSRHDTVGLVTTIKRDTTNMIYNRSTAGLNIADSLVKIYGKEVYSLMNFNLLDIYPLFPVKGFQLDKYYFFRPLTSMFSTKVAWINGIKDIGGSYTNELFKKAVNVFDSQQRLTMSEVYTDFINTDIEYVLKISY
jgi:hypothetical protein